MRTMQISACAAAIGLLGLGLTGCASTQPNLTAAGAVFYCGGAGGGPGLTNWGLGVKQGLQDAGFAGTFVEFPWETGLGVIADQDESVKAKRAQGKKLARQIADYQAKYPDSPVNLVGLSAGTAIAVYALEALPASNQVDTVVMLSSSVSSAYDLTESLRRVRGDMYVTTSPNDVVLGELAPAFGTADRKFVGQDIAGLRGFYLPPAATPTSRRLYSKVVILAWDPSWQSYGDAGAHTDTAKPAFVQHVVVPLLKHDGPRYMRVHDRGSAGSYQTASN
jgi:pimeloyl-ACP methyl ester carboxylesterase